jgi:hypothetical protein
MKYKGTLTQTKTVGKYVVNPESKIGASMFVPTGTKEETIVMTIAQLGNSFFLQCPQHPSLNKLHPTLDKAKMAARVYFGNEIKWEEILDENSNKKSAKTYLMNERQLEIIQENIMKEEPEQFQEGDIVSVMTPVEGYGQLRSMGVVKHVDAAGTIRAEFDINGKPTIIPLRPEVDKLSKFDNTQTGETLREGHRHPEGKYFIWKDLTGQVKSPIILKGDQILKAGTKNSWNLREKDMSGKTLREYLIDAFINGIWQTREEQLKCIKIN